MSKKFNTKKTLKQMGLIPNRKQREQMYLAFWIIIGIGIFVLSMVGMYKYPVPPHYYDVIGDPAVPYRNIGYTVYEVCPCGNDPECWPWDLPTEPQPDEDKYANYV